MFRPRGRLRRCSRARCVHRPEPHDARATEGTPRGHTSFVFVEPAARDVTSERAGRPPASLRQRGGGGRLSFPESRFRIAHPDPCFPRVAHISQPRVLAVIAAWHASDETETASAIPRTRSKTRPGPLAEVAGKPMVFHAWHAAHAAKCVTRCVVATDDDAVETAALAFGARVVRVDEKRRSEKELKNRFASVAAAARATAATRRAFDAVVVVDADEAFVEAHHIERVADAVIDSDAQSATCVRARDAFDARNDAGRVFLVVAELTRATATPKTKTKSVETRARYVARVFSETDASAEAARFEENEENETGRASPTRERSRSPKSPLASSREEDEKKNASASRASSKKDDAKKKKEAFFSVGVEVGVRSYVASALLETLELCEQKKKKITIKTASSASLGRGPRDEDEFFFAKRRTRSSASGDEADGEEEKNQRRRRDDRLGSPTREALLLGWRVAAVRSEESSDRNLGGLKTQRSLDAKNARIRAGEIRLARALEDATRRRR